MVKTVKVKGHRRNVYVSGKYFNFEKFGNGYRLSLGNWSDAGWHWEGNKRDLAGYLVRIAHSSVIQDFLAGMKKWGVTYKTIKVDVMTSVKSGSGMYEISGDNEMWHFGNVYDEIVEIREYIENYLEDVTDEEKEKISDEAMPNITYDRFQKSSYYKNVKKELIEKFKSANTFQELFDSLTGEGIQGIREEVFYYFSEEVAEAVEEARKKI